MVLKSKNVNNFTCILSLLLLLIIVLSKKQISDDIQFYFLIIIILLIIVSCLLDNSNISLDYLFSKREEFTNIDKTRSCYERNKEHKGYGQKIDIRLDQLRQLEENDRTGEKYKAEGKKIKELEEMNLDYLINGESF